MSDLALALMVAIRVHAKQTDKQGEPYLLHVLRLVEAVSDEAAVVAALHDVCEDSSMSLMEVRSICGLDAAEFAALCALTREDERYTDHIDLVARSPIAREVRLVDLRDNLGRIPAKGSVKWSFEPDMWESLRSRYEKAIETLEASS